MSLIPHVIHGVAHPLVSQIYVKEELKRHHKLAHVLVIRTNFDRDTEVADDGDMLLDLLADLPDISREARRQFGNDIERLEIRYN